MQAVNGQGRHSIIGEINITPLTDIFLVLLIIMMVVAPMVQQMRSDVRPPEIASGTPTPKAELAVDITQDGKFFVDGSEASEADLPRLLRDGAEALAEKKVTVRADRMAKGHAVMTVFNAVQEAGLEKIMVVGEVPKAEKDAALPQPSGEAAPK